MTTKPLKYTARSGVISFFYIKPQLKFVRDPQSNGGVISFFYIKPQLTPTATPLPPPPTISNAPKAKT